MHHALKLAAAAAVLTTAGLASAQTFTQTNRVFLPEFGAGSDFGTNPAGVAFDGTTAYVSGINSSAATGNAGAVAVTDIFGTFASSTNTGLVPTVGSFAAGRGFESIAYAPVSGSVILGSATGGSTGDIIRYNPGANTIGFTAVSPNGRRPFAVGVDPIAAASTGDSEMAAFLSQGSGRRLALDIDDGAVVYSSGAPSPGGAIIFDAELNSAYRGMDFDSDGNLAYATQNGFGFYTRDSENAFTQANEIISIGTNFVGRDVAILEGVGAGGTDLLAIASRGATTLAGQAINENFVYITDLNGTIIQEIRGDESGLSLAYGNNTKSLDFAYAVDGSPTLVVTDFVENRLDVYQVAIPEPASLGLLGVAGLGLMRRRR